MRVSTPTNNPTQSAEVSSARKAGKAAAQETKDKKLGTPVETSGDVKADLSAKGKEFARAKEVADKTPDVREEKIAALKRKIAEGKYNVSPEAVADRLVNEHLKTNIG